MTYRPPRRFTISFSLLTVLSNSPVAAANAARSSLPYNVQIYRYCYYYCCWIIIEVIFDYCYSTTIVVILCKHGISIQYSTVQYSTVQYSTVQYSTVQYSTVQHNTTQHNTTQHSTTQHHLPDCWLLCGCWVTSSRYNIFNFKSTWRHQWRVPCPFRVQIGITLRNVSK